MFQNTTVVNDFISELRTKKDDLGDLWKSTHRLMTHRHDTEVIQTYTQVHDEIKGALTKKFGHCQLPIKKMLVRTGVWLNLITHHKILVANFQSNLVKTSLHKLLSVENK